MKLSTKLCIYSLLACTGIFVAIAIMVDFYAARSESNQAERITELIQSEIARDLDSRLYTVEQSIKRTRHNLDSSGIQALRNRYPQILSSILESDSIISGCGIAIIPQAMSNGKEWMEYLKRGKTGNRFIPLGNTDYNYTGQQWYTVPVEENRCAWSPPYMDTGAGDCLMLTYTAPLTGKEGNTVAVITADISLSSLAREIHRLIPYKGSNAFVMTDNGRILDSWQKNARSHFSSSDISDIPDNISSSHYDKTITIGSDEYICCYTRAPHVDIIICTATPISSIRPVTARIKFPILIIIGIGFIALMAGLRKMIRRHLQPLDSLTDAAIKVGNGDFDTIFPSMSGYTDLQQLRDAMADMTDSLKDYIARTEESAKAEALIASQLDIARKIQRSMLPATEMDIHTGTPPVSLLIGAMQESALEVGGDLYDYLVNESALYFIIADVSGKGIPAALMTAYIKSLFHFAAQKEINPAEIVRILNENMCENNTGNMFATLLTGRIDIASHTLTLANAGHNPAILFSDGNADYLQLPPGLPVGIIPETDYTETTIPFTEDSSLFMYTDGLSEAENSSAIQYGEVRLLKAVESALKSDRNPVATIDYLSKEINSFSSSPLADDITMLCISLLPGEEISLDLKHDINEIVRLNGAISNLAESGAIEEKTAGRIYLVAEEAVSNIINHSSPKNPDDRIEFRLSVTGNDMIEIRISDSGKQFNPLEQQPEVDPDLPLELRKPGGLGIFLIRQLSDSISYEFADGRNILKIRIKNNIDS